MSTMIFGINYQPTRYTNVAISECKIFTETQIRIYPNHSDSSP